MGKNRSSKQQKLYRDFRNFPKNKGVFESKPIVWYGSAEQIAFLKDFFRAESERLGGIIKGY